MSTASKSYVKHPRANNASRTKPAAAKSYIKFPSPLSFRDSSSWRVADLCAAYSVPKGTCPGGGVIGILELGGGWTQADLDEFSAKNNLPKITVSDVSVLGGANSPGGDADVEVLLDIEVVAAVYHYATGMMPTIKMFWAPNQFPSFEAVVKAAATEGCDVLSISWGADEKRWQAGAPGAAESLETAIAEAAEAGMAVFVASGDNSSGDLDPGANVDMPSACPHAIGCGGTTKFPGTEEVVWGIGQPDGQGTGGGFSNIFAMPRWQIEHGAPVGPPLNPEKSRMVPDVAADADPQTGYLVVVNGTETTIGGTSAVAPFYSGLFAAFGRKLGFVGQALWQNPEAFTDILRGSNGSFSAAPGPDPCTGLGVPIGTSFVEIFSSTDSGSNGRAPSGKDYDGGSLSSYGSGQDHIVTVQGQGGKERTSSPRMSASSYSSFALWHGNGQVKLRINDANITADSRVVVAPSEYSTDARVDRFIGSAQISVANVAPTNGSVVIWLTVNWSSAVNVRIDYFVDPVQI